MFHWKWICIPVRTGMKQNKDIGSMKKIGITGGIGSGKSLVLTFLEQEYGASVYQADLIAHRLQMPGERCYQKIRAYFGEAILLEDGTIDRERLGKIVFEDSRKLEVLNQMVHPSVNAWIQQQMEEEEKKGTRLFVLEAALLTDPIYREMLDEIWYIHVDSKIRRARLAASRGYSEEKTDSIMASQPAEAEFIECCDRVIENGGEFGETKRQLVAALDERIDDRQEKNR